MSIFDTYPLPWRVSETNNMIHDNNDRPILALVDEVFVSSIRDLLTTVVAAVNGDTALSDQLRSALSAGVDDATLKSYRKKLDDLITGFEEDMEWRMKDELAGRLTDYVEQMARKTVEAILSGNQREMERYLGCERGKWTGRSDSPEYGRKREPHEWHPVIHGRLFETGAVALRAQIVEAHRELITDQCILDREDQVKSLVAQVNRKDAEIERLRAEMRDLR